MIFSKTGISDISSSEGNLGDFTMICQNICNNRSIVKEKLFGNMEKKLKGKSQGSFERKLSIMQKLNLIDFVNQKYLLNSFGKVLIEISNEPFLFSEKLEKVLYFIVLFSSDARTQLAELLNSINQQNGENKKKNIERYFRTEIVQHVWNKKIIEKNVQALENSGNLPSMLNNKFSCMKNWLEKIDLIEIKQEKFYLSIQKKVVKNLLDQDKIQNIYEDAAVIYYPEAQKFKIKKHYTILENFVKEGHKIFCTARTETSDAQAVSKFVCLNMLKTKIILEEDQFFKLTGKLKTDEIIRSVMIGRNGEPVSFSVN